MKKISDLNGHDAIRVQNEQEKKEIQKLLDENGIKTWCGMSFIGYEGGSAFGSNLCYQLNGNILHIDDAMTFGVTVHNAFDFINS